MMTKNFSLDELTHSNTAQAWRFSPVQLYAIFNNQSTKGGKRWMNYGNT